MKHIKNISMIFLIWVSAGCVTIYKSLPEGPDTAKIFIQYVGPKLTQNVGIFNDGKECRGGGAVPFDPTSKSRVVVVPAKTISIQMASIGFNGLKVSTCGGILTFEAKGNSQYKFTEYEGAETCHFVLQKYVDRNWIDISDKLINRELANLALPSGPNRPFCKDKYQDSGE